MRQNSLGEWCDFQLWIILGAAALVCCSPSLNRAGNDPVQNDGPRPRPIASTQAIAIVEAPASALAEAPTDGERSAAVAWLRAHLPPGGEIDDRPGRPLSIVHVSHGETSAQIAEAYFGLTEVYLPHDLNLEIRRANEIGAESQPKGGDRVVIPQVVQHAPKAIDDERLRWPEDKTLRGLYVRGATAETPLFMAMLRRMSDRGMNLIVLDTKDYDGLLTYASKVPLAVETGAARGAPMHDLPRTIRFAHKMGIRVAMRISCFEDEFMTKAKPSLAIVSKYGGPYPIGWFDPTSEGAQQYVIDLAQEAIDAGADEIQLDYVRYPVLGIKNADFRLEKRKLTKVVVIRDFVRRVHEVTSARHVPLSLDIFGVVADGQRQDIDMLGQDPSLLVSECEALSPMVYPSHYRTGYQGFEIPGNHPEIVGIGTKKILAQLKGKGGAVIRPWLQAVSYNSPDYGPPYIAAEVWHANHAGATGWLMWNPAQTYTVTWRAIPPQRSASPEATETE